MRVGVRKDISSERKRRVITMNETREIRPPVEDVVRRSSGTFIIREKASSERSCRKYFGIPRPPGLAFGFEPGSVRVIMEMGA